MRAEAGRQILPYAVLKKDRRSDAPIFPETLELLEPYSQAGPNSNGQTNNLPKSLSHSSHQTRYSLTARPLYFDAEFTSTSLPRLFSLFVTRRLESYI
jgi:hypothetical protein